MRPTAELRVPMVPVAVELAAVDAPPAPCEVYLPDAPRRDHHVVADDLAKLLEADAPFLPVRSGTGVAMIGKHAIHWLALAIREDDAADGAPAEGAEPLTLFDSRHDVEVILVDGSTLSGAILHSSPADKPRVIDYLNRPGRFVRLWAPRAQYLINKHCIARVREIGTL